VTNVSKSILTADATPVGDARGVLLTALHADACRPDVCFMPQTSVMPYPITFATQTMIKPKRTCVLTSAIGDSYAASVIINDHFYSAHYTTNTLLMTTTGAATGDLKRIR